MGYLYSLKVWISYGSFMYIGDTISAFSKFLMIPLVAHFTLNYLNEKNYYKFLNFIKIISIYFIISAIPFVLNILEDNGKGYDLSKYGLANSYGYIGLAQSPHNAAVKLSISIIVLIFFLYNSKKLWTILKYLSLIIFGLYLEYKTYVRTGYLSLLAGIYFLSFKDRPLKTRVIVFILFAIFSYGIYNIYEQDKVLQMRLEDKNIYNQETDEDKLGSGRLLYSKTNIENLFSSNVFIIFFGLGREYSKDLMGQKIGRRLISHNGYVDALTDNGIIGFILFMLMIYYAYKIINMNKNKILYNLTYSIFISFLSVCLTQSYEFYFLNVFLSILLILLPRYDYYLNLTLHSNNIYNNTKNI